MRLALPSARVRILAGCLALGGLVACGDDDSTGPGPVARLEINNLAETDTLGVGSAVTLHPVILDASNRVVTGAEYSWSSSNEAVATVSDIGEVEIGDAAGSAVIRLESGGVRDSVMLTVVRVEIRGGPGTIAVGDSGQFTVALVGPNGDIPGQEFDISSSDEEIAEVNAEGWVIGVEPGVVDITASWSGPHGDVRDEVALAITEDPGTIPPLRASVRRR